VLRVGDEELHCGPQRIGLPGVVGDLVVLEAEWPRTAARKSFFGVLLLGPCDPFTLVAGLLLRDRGHDLGDHDARGGRKIDDAAGHGVESDLVLLQDVDDVDEIAHPTHDSIQVPSDDAVDLAGFDTLQDRVPLRAVLAGPCGDVVLAVRLANQLHVVVSDVLEAVLLLALDALLFVVWVGADPGVDHDALRLLGLH